ncbi:hypothetical protein JH06_4892 [Blastocystis sp. subtype 4]|uniref:hypothetical protein n=1 Tax=Blastocystis sp. subtype 4 TaxID=944170 RepID=UPI0007115502|nr:hypothetical protein JH06_4892 [Blastocystis sp. subtype 4]KNB41657.1 hypothetical protein JH06_4892 [Blastocystis sp. subtype 4]|eukprot:XP_014525100.1 hypothetical protein JH06_4892 [Blastocystis sp. subtype 4]
MLGKWLDDEQERFIKAMELFPKDWNKITAYVGTRTKQQVQSHAQKYQRHLEDAKLKYDLFHYWADDEQDRTQRIKRKRVPINYSTFSGNLTKSSSTSTRRSVEGGTVKKCKIDKSQDHSALPEQHENWKVNQDIATDNMCSGTIFSSPGSVSSSEVSTIGSQDTNNDEDAAKLLVSLRTADLRINNRNKVVSGTSTGSLTEGPQRPVIYKYVLGPVYSYPNNSRRMEVGLPVFFYPPK